MEEIAMTRGINAQLDGMTDAKEYYVRRATSVQLASFWDEGSKDMFCAYDAQGMRISLPAHSGATQFGGNSAEVQLDGKPYATIVRCSVYRGKRMKPAIYVQPALYDAIDAQVADAQNTGSLTDAQLKVLAVSAHLKSFARKEAFDTWAMRNNETGDFDAIRAQLRDMQLLRKNNAITPAGRNAASDVSYH